MVPVPVFDVNPKKVMVEGMCTDARCVNELSKTLIKERKL